MPDSRNHRGAHPKDARDFAPSTAPRLLRAVRELSFLLKQRAAELPFALTVTLSERVDAELAASPDIVGSSDSWILDRAARWIDLPALVADDAALPLWLVDLSEAG